MNNSIDAQGLLLAISAVERETGLSKDVLRMWERRYGFPQPGRDENGERQYTASDIGKLRAIKRLLDIGLRPGKIMALSLAELNAMADARQPPRSDQIEPELERDVLAMLRSHDVTAPPTCDGESDDAARPAEVRAGHDHAIEPDGG